jgi:hypothetical protein
MPLKGIPRIFGGAELHLFRRYSFDSDRFDRIHQISRESLRLLTKVSLTSLTIGGFGGSKYFPYDRVVFIPYFVMDASGLA